MFLRRSGPSQHVEDKGNDFCSEGFNCQFSRSRGAASACQERMGIGSGAIGRRAQASHDALRRRQKAKAAAKVKKHRRFKNKAKLFAQLESTRTLETTPIVAAEYDDSLAEDERVSTEKARNGFEVEKEACSQKRKHLSGQPKSKEGCVHGNSPGSSSVAFLAPSADSGDMQSAQDSDPRRQVIDSVVAVARNRQQRDLASQDSVELFLKNSEGNDQNMLAAENQLRGSTLSPKGSRYQPFKKELAIAAARRLEIVSMEFLLPNSCLGIRAT